MKDNILKFLKFLFTLVALIIAYNIMMILISLFPTELIYENCLKSSQTLLEEGNMLFHPLFEQTDDYTDGLIINEAYSIDSSTPIESYLRIRKNYNKDITKYQLPDTSEELHSYSENNIVNRRTNSR